MTKKSTKRALISSVVSLLICFTMLLGTTFAWFTDSVVSGNNIITAGNLDMKVSYKPYGAEKTEWTEVKEDTVIFGKDAKYEPGYTEAVWLKIENAGSLAFKYAVSLNATEKEGVNKEGKTFKLSDYLNVKYANISDVATWEAFYETRESFDSFSFGDSHNSGETKFTNGAVSLINNGVALPSDGTTDTASYVLVIIEMPTTVGNEANHNGTDVPKIDFTLTAVATQVPNEEDSFGSDYDANAQYEYPDMGITTAEEFVEAFNSATSDVTLKLANDIALGDVDIVLDDNITYTLDLNGHTLSATAQAFNVYSGATLNIENGTIDRTNSDNVEGRFVTVGGHAENGHGDGCDTMDKAVLNLRNVEMVSTVATRTGGSTQGQIIHVLCGAEVNLYDTSIKTMMVNGKYANHIDVYNWARNCRVNVYEGCSFYGNPERQEFKNSSNTDWVATSGYIQHIKVAEGYKLQAGEIAEGDAYAWYTVVPK